MFPALFAGYQLQAEGVSGISKKKNQMAGREVSLSEAESCGEFDPNYERDLRPSVVNEHDMTKQQRRRYKPDNKGVVNGKTRLVREDSATKAWSIMREVDPWTSWFYKPHTVLFLLTGGCLLVWASGALQPQEIILDKTTNTKRGIWAIIAVFLGYCLLQAPSTILIRPHPAVWRFVHGIAILYLILLVFLLFQNRDDARQFMRYLHPDLGVELEERSYGGDCRVYTPEKANKFSNVYDTFFDEFVVAHTLGWWCKAIMIRNLPLLWVLSIGFEFCEQTFKHMLPNFNECWWDSIILDVLVCNTIGIYLGMKSVKYFDGKTYEWIGLSRQTSFSGKVWRSLGQFSPAYWDKDEWNPLQGPVRFLQVLGLVVLILAVEVECFFLKYCLWVPPLNPLVTYRLIIWWLIANPAIREYNTFLQTRKSMKLGAFCWLAAAISTVETLICIKFGRGLYPQPMPGYVFWSLISAVVALILFLGWWTMNIYLANRMARDFVEENTKKTHEE